MEYTSQYNYEIDPVNRLRDSLRSHYFVPKSGESILNSYGPTCAARAILFEPDIEQSIYWGWLKGFLTETLCYYLFQEIFPPGSSQYFLDNSNRLLDDSGIDFTIHDDIYLVGGIDVKASRNFGLKVKRPHPGVVFNYVGEDFEIITLWDYPENLGVYDFINYARTSYHNNAPCNPRDFVWHRINNGFMQNTFFNLNREVMIYLQRQNVSDTMLDFLYNFHIRLNGYYN